MPSQASILLYGRDEQLLQSRQLLLQRGGYEVWVATGLAEIDVVSRLERIDLLILCHSLTLEECGRALAFGQSRWPFMKSLILSAVGSWSEAGELPQVFDTTLGPERLLSTLSRLLNDRTNPIASELNLGVHAGKVQRSTLGSELH
jgi:hypothetical protein